MMITVKDRRTGETHTGRSPESIARRLYGRRAWVKYSAVPGNSWEAWALTPVPGQDNTSNIEANWYLNEDALAATERYLP